MVPDKATSMDAIVLVNSSSPGYRAGREYVLPALDHLGLPCRELDLAYTPLPADVGQYALVIVAHGELDPTGARLGRAGRHALLAAVGAGTGLVTFDPVLPAPSELGETASSDGPENRVHLAETIGLAGPGGSHYITARRDGLDIAPFLDALLVPELVAPDETVLLRAGRQPLLAVAELGRGRVARWATSHWLDSHFLGPLAGLDGVLWRSLVWAARKPFAMRGLPPLVTMRVDDVAGTGGMWDRSPFYWVHVANESGFKPWMGIFPYNLTPEAVSELRDLILRGQATAFPHALGRPPRPGPFSDVHYWEGAIPVRGGDADDCVYRGNGRPWPSDLDEFIFYDHHRARAWTDLEAARGLAAADAWYAAHSPLPISRYALVHFGEVGSNTIAHIHEEWGADLIGQFIDLDQPLVLETPWLRGGPFRRYEEPGTGAIVSTRRGRRPLYYADFVNLGGYQFFNCISEVGDVAGYEWTPDNDVAKTVRNGVRQLRRELDSMALAVLFTHETDRIYRIRPDAWAQEIAGVVAGIADYDPIYVTADDGVRYVRATRTSRLESCQASADGREVTATLAGCADVPTHFQLFTEERGEISRTLVPVPVFEDRTAVTMTT